MPLGSCLEDHSTTLGLENGSCSQADASLLHSRVTQGLLAGLWEQPQAGWDGGQASAVPCLRRLDACARSVGKPAGLADRVVRKSRCHKNNPS